MKAQLAVALSLVGVLGAGSAAALVNTQILDSNPSSSGASSAVRPPAASVDVTIPSTTAVPSTVAASTVAPTTAATAPSTSMAPTTTGAPAGADTLTAFNVGDAGVVTVDLVGGRVVLVSAEPKDGWMVVQAEEHEDDNNVEIEFRSATQRVEFEAHLVDGRIVPSVEASSLGGAPAPNGAATAGATANSTAAGTPTVTAHDDDHGNDRDDDHDEYVDDDHDERDDDHSGSDHEDDHEDERDDD